MGEKSIWNFSEATSFIEFLVNLCGIYDIKKDGSICCDERYLAVSKRREHYPKRIDVKKSHQKDQPFRIFREGMEVGDYIVFNPYIEESNTQNWLLIHLERICGCLTKKIILVIVQSLIYDDANVLDKLSSGMRERLKIARNDKDILTDIEKIPECSILSLEYDKKNHKAYAIFQLSSQSAEYKLIPYTPKAVKTIKAILEEIFGGQPRNSQIPPNIGNEFCYSTKSKKNKKFDAKMHVILSLLRCLDDWVRSLLNYNIEIENLVDHISKLGYYYSAYSWLKTIDFGEVVLIGKDGNIMPEKCSFDNFYSDQNKKSKKKKKLIRPRINNYDDNIIFFNKHTMETTLRAIPQDHISVCQLEKNPKRCLENNDLQAYISEVISNYNPLSTRDYNSEVEFIMKEKIIIRLLMTLEDRKELNKWLPGVTVGGAHLSYKGFALNIYEHLYNQQALQRIDSKYMYSNWPMTDFFSLPNNLLELYALVNGCVDSNDRLDYLLTLNTLTDKFDISKNNVYQAIEIPQYSGWQPSDDKGTCYRGLSQQANSIIFRSKNGAITYSLIRIECNGMHQLLPVTNFVKDNENPASFFVMPSFEKFPLLNLDYISYYSHASIILTDDIELAYKHGTECCEDGIIWSSWYGGGIAINSVDFEPLKGRKIYYLCKDIDSKDALSTTLKVLDKLQQESESYLNIMGIASSQKCIKYKHKEIIGLSRQKKIYVPKNLHRIHQGHIDTNRKDEHPAKYVIDEIIETGTLTMIYAPAGLGKTWLALSIALAVANGRDVFDIWKVTSEPKGVAYFAGEMARETNEDRIMFLNNIYNQSDNKYLLAERRSDIDLSTSDGQKVVDQIINTFSHENDIKISLLIIDNINTLAEGATKDKGWQEFYDWLQSKKGITTILIHHPNKEGGYLGTSKIINKLDLMIYAGETDDMKLKLAKLFKDDKIKIEECLRPILSNNISMFISAKKERLNDKFKRFWLTLVDVKKSDIRWEVTLPEYEELLEENGYSMDDFSKMLENEYINNAFEPNKYQRPIKTDTRLQHDIPKGKDFLNLDIDEQKDIITTLYKSGPNGKMTSKKMAEVLEISKRKLDEIRKKTGTLKRDFEKQNQ